jgi:hypothetical protein
VTPSSSIVSVAPLRTRSPARRLGVAWRRLRLMARRDPLAGVVSAADAVRLADQMLIRTAIRCADSTMWCGVARTPLAALIHTASAAGHGYGVAWVRDTASRLHDADAGDEAWHQTQVCCNRPTASLALRTALPRLRAMEPRQRRGVTRVMVEAASGLGRQNR